MNCLTKAGTRAVCAGLAVMAVLSWSCTKEPSFDGDTGQQAEGAIAQARSYYESTASSLTKTVGDQTVAIKPLPGDLTPLWDKASASVLSDGTTAWVDVPITAGVTYTAVRGGAHHHEAGEDCGHNHNAIQAVQKLTVYTAADGTKQSLIATIVPEADCTVELNGFSSATGLAGFSGFVSWHDLTGKLVRVASYENGTQTRSVEANEENHTVVLEIVDNAILYPVNPAISKSFTKTINVQYVLRIIAEHQMFKQGIVICATSLKIINFLLRHTVPAVRVVRGAIRRSRQEKPNAPINVRDFQLNPRSFAPYAA